MKVQRWSIHICILVASLSACDGADDLNLTHRSDDIYCPRWQCGYNTSEINGKSIQELHLDGQANAAGVELIGFATPLDALGYELDVEGDELVARGPMNTTLRGVGLVGSVISLRIDGQTALPVTIAAYEEVESWADGAAPVPAYALVYADEIDPTLERSVCKGTLVDPLQASVVILAGERYDASSKTVIPNQNRWFTLACAGSAAAKMALLGYGPHADFDGQGAAASVDQRQATLKMITADYCGTGESYTVDGTPLVWENHSGTVTPSAEPGASEAVWTSTGALCLDTPRVVEREAVACLLPTCDEFGVEAGEWITHSPIAT